jgi:hypothetical protein
VWVGIGCGALLFLGGAAAWGVYAFVVRPVQEAQEAASAITNGTGASITVGDGGVVLNMPGVGQITAPTSDPASGDKARAPSGGTASPGGGATATPTATTTTNPALPSVDAGSLAVGGASCVQAAACCHAVMEKTGAGAQSAACDNMKSMPEVGCAQALATYRKTAPLVGAKCP